MFGFVTPDGVAAVHAAGRRVSTWTVDDAADVVRVLDVGVYDVVVSNRIAALLEHLGRPPRSRSAAVG